MRRTNIYLADAQASALDEVARRQGISRAELLRRLIDRSLESQTVDLETDLAAIRESFGVLRNEQAHRRGADERSAHLDRLRRS